MHEASLSGVDRKRPATTENGTQRPLCLHGVAPPPQSLRLLPEEALRGATFSDVLRHCVLHDGSKQYAQAAHVLVSAGYMSRFLGGLGEQWAKRVIALMKSTGWLGPLQWMAYQVGCDLVQRDSRAARIAELEAALADARRVA
jgi:hypothetical protein